MTRSPRWFRRALRGTQPRSEQRSVWDVQRRTAPRHATVIGILNVTPDSFSDGERFNTADSAIAHGLALIAAGADYVDVGGESTRPGAQRVDEAEELRRVLPVVDALTAGGARVSIDTTRSQVAASAIAAGATLVNDVSGGLADPKMASVIADSGVDWVLMHWRGPSRTMQNAASYRDVVAEVSDELRVRIDSAVGAGVAPEQLILDPGIGFAKRPEHDLALLSNVARLVRIGLPLLIGASRKSVLGTLLARTGAPAATRPDQRDAATLATSVLAVVAGAWGVRVHEVAATVDALRVAEAISPRCAAQAWRADEADAAARAGPTPRLARSTATAGYSPLDRP